jgi:hypothetical protein
MPLPMEVPRRNSSAPPSVLGRYRGSITGK